MNLTELFQYYNNKMTDKTLTLTSEGEAGKIFARLLTAVRLEGLAMSDCALALKPEEKPRMLEITGKASFPPLNKGESFFVTIQCEEESEKIKFSLNAACHSTTLFRDFWGFIYSVDPTTVSGLDFSDEDLQSITISQPVFTTESDLLGETFPFRISGSVSFQNCSGWSGFASLLTGTLRMEGAFSFLDYLSVPYWLKINLLGDFRFLSANVGHNTDFFKNVGLSVMLYNGVDDYVNAYGKISTAEFLCNVSIKGLATPISLSAPVFTRPDYFAFQVGFEEGLGIGDIVNFIASLFQTGNDMGTLLIPNHSLLNGVKLTNLSFLMSREEDFHLQMQMAEAKVRTSNPIQLLPMLTLEDLQVYWSMMWGDADAQGERSYFLSAQIQTNVRISLLNNKSLLLNAKGRLPELELEAKLALIDSNKDYHFADVLGAAAADVPGYEGSPSIIGGVELYASYQNRNLNILAYTRDILSFHIGSVEITLQKVYAGARFTQQGNRYSFGGVIAFETEDNRFQLSLEGSYENATWTFVGTLSYGYIDIGNLIQAFLGIRTNVEQENYLKIILSEFDICYVYKKGASNRFTLKAGFTAEWGGAIFQNINVHAGGQILLETEQNKKTNLSAMLGLNAGGFGISVQAINFFSEAVQYVVEVKFNQASIKGSYYKDSNQDEIIAICLTGLTLGDIVAEVASFVYPNFKYGLPAPWNVLDKVELSKLSFHMNLTKKEIAFSYKLDLNILGLFKLNEVKLTYDYHLDSIVLAVVTDEQEYGWDPVTETPPVGNGKTPFKLYYLGMAQHFSTDGVKKANSIAEAIEALKNDFKPTTGELPAGLKYDDETNWLFGMDFLLCNALNVKLVLNDPQIYGLLITVKGEEAPFATFNGLTLELLYKKITKDIGMFRATLLLPDKFRRFQLGYISVTLGVISVEIYTNGNFLIDLGFPYNKNFSRSFLIEVGIYTGRGGFYFGSLNGQTCNKLPVVRSGSFDTAITLGLGLSIGMGRSFDFGVVSGGFSLEVFGVFEGLFAVYKPSNGGENTLYYYAKASLGIVGRLFLSVDFKIISIDASVEIRAYAEVVLEAYKAMKFMLAFSLEMKASVKILFIKIKFSFQFNKTFQFSIGENKHAPWESLNEGQSLSERNLRVPVLTNARIFASKREISLWINPIFSFTDNKTDYCVGFIPSIDSESFLILVELLARNLTSIFDSELTMDYKHTAMARKILDEVDYEWICQLLKNNIDIKLKSGDYNTFANTEMDGVLMPMPPPLVLRFESETNDGVEVKYDEENLVSEQYSEWIKEYFKELEPNPNREQMQNKYSSENLNPLAELVFTDYFNMLFRQIHSEIKTYFDRFTILSDNLIHCEEQYGVSLEKVLTDNIYLKVASLPFTIAKKRYVTKRGDSLKSISKELNIEASTLRQSIGDTNNILLIGTEFPLNAYSFELRGLSREEVAALMFVRWHFDAVDSYYQGYCDGIYSQLHDAIGVEFDWECVDEDIQITLPDENGTYKWQVLPGDTVERIAAYWEIYHLPRGENEEWDAFLAAVTVEKTDYTILPDTQISIQKDATINELYRRIYPDKPRGFTNDPIFTLSCLKEASPLIIEDVVYAPHEETDFFTLIHQYGLTMAELAESILYGGLQPVSGQNVELLNVKAMGKEEMLNILMTSSFPSDLASLSSRFLLQGMRLIKYDDTERTYAYYELLKQQMLYVNDGGNRRLTVSPTQKGEGWLSGDIDMLMNPEYISERLPNDTYKWDERLCIPVKPIMDSFQSIPACYSVSDIRLIQGEHVSTVFFYPDALKRDISLVHELELKRDDEAVPVTHALLMPFRVQCTGEDGIFKVMGFDSKNRLALEKLMDSDDLKVELLYKASTLNAVSDTFLSIPADVTKTAVVKTNLSKETHMYPVIEKITKEDAETENYTANMGEHAFLRILWECSVVGGGGYYLQVHTDGKSIVPSDIIDENGMFDLWLTVYENDGCDLQKAGVLNCAVSDEVAIPDKLYSFYEMDASNEKLQNWMPTLPVGRYGVEFTFDAKSLQGETDDHYDMHEMFNIFSYRIHHEGVESKDSKPLMPIGVASEDDIWRYVSILPLYHLTGDTEGNPYSALGKRFDFYLYCRDLLGNCINLQDGKHLCTIRPQYNDFVISASEWPKIAMAFDVKKEMEKAHLNIYLEFDDNGEVNEASIEKLRLSIWQLEFEFERGMYCPIFISSPLFAEEFPITDNQFYMLIAYLKEVLRYFTGESDSPPAGITLSYSIDTDIIVTKLFPLEVFMNIKRNRMQSDIEKAMQTSTAVAARILAGDGGDEKALALFAENFEDALPGFVLGHSSDERELYAFKIGKNGLIESVDIGPYKKGDVSYPRYYALKPINNAPVSQSVYVTTFDGLKSDSEKTLVSFTDIDMEQWARRFIGDLEYFLSEEFVSKLFLLDRLVVNNLIDLKKQLADAIVTQLIPIEDGMDYDATHVKELLKDRLLRSLESGYRIASVGEYQLSAEAEEGVRLSVSCQASDTVIAEAGKIDPTSDSFCIFYEACDPYTTGFSTDLEFSVNELEYHINKRGDYESSEWLKLILPITNKTSRESFKVELTSDLLIPNPLRSCPASPTMNGHEFVLGGTRWNYELSSTLFATEQDAYHYHVEFKKEDFISNSMSFDTLFQALAQYDYVRDELLSAISGDVAHIELFIELASEIVSAWNGHMALMDESTNINDERVFQGEMHLDVSEGQIRLDYDEDVWKAEITSNPDINFLNQSNTGEFLLTIKDLSIFELNCAEPTLWIVRNQDVLKTKDTSLVTNPAFIYQTEEKSLPKLLVSGESLEHRYLGKLETRISYNSILDALELYSDSLELSKADNVCDLVISYSYSLDDNSFTPKIRIPVAMFNGIKCKSIRGNAQIAQSVWSWFSHSTSENDNGLIFDLTVYSSSERQILLRICNIEVGFKQR